mgnify:CR=1 FL=1
MSETKIKLTNVYKSFGKKAVLRGVNLDIKKGEIVYGKVTNILGYGAFVTVEDYDGLIHISEFSDNFVRDDIPNNQFY